MIDQPEDDFDFDAFFELWQAGEEDTHVQQVLEALDAQGRPLVARARDEQTGAANAGPPLPEAGTPCQRR